MSVTIVTRTGKGSILTHNEVDANFTNLKTAVEQAASDILTLAANITTNATSITNLSTTVTNLTTTVNNLSTTVTANAALPATRIPYGSAGNLQTNSAELTYTSASASFIVANSGNVTTQIAASNTSAGANAGALISANNNNGSILTLWKRGGSQTPNGLVVADAGWINNTGALLVFTTSFGTDFLWTAGGTTASDVAMRLSGGVLTVGAPGVTAGVVKTVALTVADLPAAATAGVGARAFVTDASTTLALGIGTTVTGGGANKVPIYSDGANWKYG